MARLYSHEGKLKIARDFCDSGLSMDEFSRRSGASISSIHRWKKLLENDQVTESNPFAVVKVKQENEVITHQVKKDFCDWSVRIRAKNEVTIEISEVPSANWMVEIIRGLV